MTEIIPISECKTVEELLRVKDRWTRHTAARNKYGDRVVETSPEAVCFCVVGALCKIYGSNPQVYLKVGRAIIKRHSDRDISGISLWNDAKTTTFEEVREVILEAGV